MDSRDALVPAHGEYALVPSGPASQPASRSRPLHVGCVVRAWRGEESKCPPLGVHGVSPRRRHGLAPFRDIRFRPSGPSSWSKDTGMALADWTPPGTSLDLAFGEMLTNVRHESDFLTPMLPVLQSVGLEQ